MTDRFRLIYLKSAGLGKNHLEQINPSPDEAKDPGRTFASSHNPAPETHATREILKQAKADLKHPDPKVRILAVKYYLEKSHLSITMNLLREILSDPDSGVRAEALSTLITFGSPIVSPFLKKYLRDPDPMVRMVALRGMFRFKEKMDLNLLMQFLSDDSSGVRRKVATLLGWNQIEGVLPILVEMSKDEDSKVRKAALFSLVTLYPEEGEQRLMEAMTDADPDIRKWARDQLNRMLERPTTKMSIPLSR
ncbi:MAG: HEAT repeat domain-containing protein [Deltaproteobacteria bacterium]|nr:HEAT repeat domain-containing protein [Deltaproteobacteria bacterium]